MMRLLFLCLLLPTATALTDDEMEGSGPDDEDLIPILKRENQDVVSAEQSANEESADHLTLIVVVVAVVALALSIAAIVTIMLVRRHMHTRQQGIYSVPTEQDKKGTV